jgi:hypothetical protein
MSRRLIYQFWHRIGSWFWASDQICIIRLLYSFQIYLQLVKSHFHRQCQHCHLHKCSLLTINFHTYYSIYRKFLKSGYKWYNKQIWISIIQLLIYKSNIATFSTKRREQFKKEIKHYTIDGSTHIFAIVILDSSGFGLQESNKRRPSHDESLCLHHNIHKLTIRTLQI